jgi:hypothetical protein
VAAPVLAAVLALTSLAAAGPSSRAPSAAAPALTPAESEFLDDLQERTFRFFWERTPEGNGLTPDRWPTPSFSSIAAVGFALTAYPIGVEHGWITRAQARQRVLATLRFFKDAPMGEAATGVTGHRGFYYHFLDMKTGQRFQQVELSTIDTTLLMAGVLFCQSYFDQEQAEEKEIRGLAEALYARVDWRWAVARPPRVSMGWKPEEGFLPTDWTGYDESTILYVLALGSPTHPADPAGWEAYTRTYVWGPFLGEPHVNFGPLFGHQYSHVWIDFRGIRDAYMREKNSDYFENARRATLSQRAYAILNPRGFRDYGKDVWGLTACDGPSNVGGMVDGRWRGFSTYRARGAALTGIDDDGTIAPTAAASALPYAPEVVLPALQEMKRRYGDRLYSTYGFKDAFNPTFPVAWRAETGQVDPERGWFDVDYLGIDQGPIVAMIENHRSGLVWEVMKKNPHIRRGLTRAGFSGGWLDAKAPLAR